MKCLKTNFNLDLNDLCDDAKNSIPNVWGTVKKMKEIDYVKNRCLTKNKTSTKRNPRSESSKMSPRKDFKKNIIKIRSDNSKNIDSQIEELEKKIKLLESLK
jgi:hypothetical protein